MKHELWLVSSKIKTVERNGQQSVCDGTETLSKK